MPGDYATLAPIYDRIGMSDYADVMPQRLLRFAQQNEWMGRRIIDLGCGTGASTIWFATNRYNVTGLDNSPEMVALANQNLQEKGLGNARVVAGDIRDLQIDEAYDMALALDVFNELDGGVKELEVAFQSIHRVLPVGRWLIFDLHTTGGLAQDGMAGDKIIHDADDLMVFSKTGFDFERQTHTQLYTIFSQQAGNAWQRRQARRTLKAYPVSAVTTLLRRTNYELLRVMNTQLTPYDVTYDLNSSPASRVIFAVRRQK